MATLAESTERQRRAWQMRQGGKTFRAIAEALSATPGGAQIMVRTYARKQEMAKITSLPVRARNVPKNHGVDFTDPHAVANLTEVQLLRQYNTGRKTIHEIKKWLATHGLALR